MDNLFMRHRSRGLKPCYSKVSVVVPAYNEERFIGACLKSLLNQTLQPLEIIIVDDGSSDETYNVAHNIAAEHSNFTILRLRENGGLPAALNAGFRVATGQYVTWISADNFSDERFIAVLCKALDDEAATGVVFSDTVLVHADGSTPKVVAAADPSQLLQRNVVRSCFMFRASLIELVGPHQQRWTLVEDYHFWLSCRSKGIRFRYVPGTYVYHRIHDRSLSSIFSLKIRKRDLILRSLFTRRAVQSGSLQDPFAIARLVADSSRINDFKRHLRYTLGWIAKASLRWKPSLIWVLGKSAMKSAFRHTKRI